MVLTNFPEDPLLDLPPYVGQRQATFRFDWINGVTGEVLGQLHPLRTATLSHTTEATIKRTMSLSLDQFETEAVNTIQDRVLPFMVFPNGREYPLGRFMFTDSTRQVFTSGRLGAYSLSDEMFLVDQPILEAVSGIQLGAAIDPTSISVLIADTLSGLPISFSFEPNSYTTTGAWGIGTNRGSILGSLAVAGDYFSPWFDNTGVLRFIRAFEPADQIPDFDFDAGNQVLRADIVEGDNLLTAPNLFIVISNNSDTPGTAVQGSYSVPDQAPHSVFNRGFTIANVQQLQVSTNDQAQAVARNIGIRQTIFEQVSLTTAPDPRHDSYNVIHWQGSNWLELGWTLQMVEGGAMSHMMRKAYS